METVDYCRAIEAYLCQKNDGHLIRVVGPAFELVSGWDARGVPLKIACAGIDRYCERYYRSGPRRRPVRIEFCDADVLDAFDEWRRALGLAAGDQASGGEAGHERPSSSLPAHLERVVARLTAVRVNGSVDEGFDDVIDRIARELDVARSSPQGVRGEARQALLARLAELDGELLRLARVSIDEAALAALVREANGELSGYRERMAPDAFARSRDAAVDRLLRDLLGLPVVTFQ